MKGKTSFYGTNKEYKQLLEKVNELSKLVYNIGWGLSDLPYFCLDKDKIKNENDIFNNIDNQVKTLKTSLENIITD